MTKRSSDRPVLITGASGFVGQYLLAELNHAGYDVDAIHTMSQTADKSSAGVGAAHVCDLTDRQAVERLIAQIRPSGVVHLAAISLPAKARAEPDLAWRVNFEAVRWVAEAILTHADDARLVLAGSSEAYGWAFNLVDGPLTETSCLRPMTPYAATKAAADVLLGQMSHQGLEAVRLRAFNHTGPGQSSDFVVPAFANQVARIKAGKQPPRLSVGNLDAERDFLDVRDVVKGYRLALEANLGGPGDHVFNLASTQPRSIRSILDELLTIAGVEAEIQIDPTKLRRNEVPRTWGARTRAQTVLGWSPTIELSQTLSDMLRASLAGLE